MLNRMFVTDETQLLEQMKVEVNANNDSPTTCSIASKLTAIRHSVRHSVGYFRRFAANTTIIFAPYSPSRRSWFAAADAARGVTVARSVSGCVRIRRVHEFAAPVREPPETETSHRRDRRARRQLVRIGVEKTLPGPRGAERSGAKRHRQHSESAAQRSGHRRSRSQHSSLVAGDDGHVSGVRLVERKRAEWCCCTPVLETRKKGQIGRSNALDGCSIVGIVNCYSIFYFEGFDRSSHNMRIINGIC